MNIVMTLFVLVGMAVVLLAIVLAVQFVRLSRELHRFSDDTGSMIVSVRRGLRTIHLAIPLMMTVRTAAGGVYKKLRSRIKKEST